MTGVQTCALPIYVTVKMKNSSFIQVAKEIQKQTELTFLYNDAKVGNITGLNPDFTNTDVKAVLEYCLKNSGLTFSIVDNTVVVSPVKLTSQQQENKLTVVGKISDQQGLPLPGVNIIIKGTTLGFVSDVEGKFTAICSRGDSLLFSMGFWHTYTGSPIPFLSKSTPITGQSFSQCMG